MCKVLVSKLFLDPISSLLVLFFVLLIGERSLESLRLRRFKSDRYEIWHDCFSRKYVSSDEISRYAHVYTYIYSLQ